MEFRFVHFYPDLMSLYGSYANLSVLQRLLEQLGGPGPGAVFVQPPGRRDPLRRSRRDAGVFCRNRYGIAGRRYYGQQRCLL